MSHYTVYLELDTDGRCLAHVPALPGCVVRAPSRAEVLERLPAALDAHLAWLRRHGEPVSPVGKPLTFEIAGEHTGGPFDPGDTAALLPPDREPLALDEMEDYFRLMTYTRADLLALSQHLPDDLLDWQPTPESFSIRRILRHVGNAEEWYVSRLVPPDSLPSEWDDDEDLPPFDFLAMERRTAITRLRQLTEAERAAVLYPTAWTRHPDEPWTACKALRRFLEHELEHTAQVREVLAAHHRCLQDDLDAARAELLAAAALVPIEERAWRPICGEWTLKDLLGHIADWEAVGAEGLAHMAAGRAPRIDYIPDVEAWNQAHAQARRDQPWAEVWADLEASRHALAKALASTSTDQLYRTFAFPWGVAGTPHEWISVFIRHDREHTHHLRQALNTDETRERTKAA